ncbi:MAG: hypothetical protein AVDCRST_MAG77-5697, partial [uncultured Chloroflexi bacterium]
DLGAGTGPAAGHSATGRRPACERGARRRRRRRRGCCCRV